MTKPKKSRKSAYERQVDAALRPVRLARESLVRASGGTVAGLVKFIEESYARRIAAKPPSGSVKPRRRRSA